MSNPELDTLREENKRLKAWLGVIADPHCYRQSQTYMAQKALEGEPVPSDPWNDPHFPKGTETHEIFAHLRSVHADRAPWGNAFIDDPGNEYPPRVVSVHAWCHREDEWDLSNDTLITEAEADAAVKFFTGEGNAPEAGR